MPKKKFSETGAIPLLLPLIGLLVLTFLISSNIQTSTKFSDQDVQGVLIAKNDNARSGNAGEHRNNENARPTSNTSTTQEDRRKGGPSTTNQGGSRIETKNRAVTESETATPSATPSNQIDDQLRSISKFPLRIDTQTNQLIMTKDGVERVLTVLPERAVQNMLRAHLKKGLGPKFFGEGTPSASPTATPSAQPLITESSTDITVLENQIELEERGGKPVYKIPAVKHLKLFGFIPISTQFTDFVSAETGNLVEEQQSLLARLLDLLSP